MGHVARATAAGRMLPYQTFQFISATDELEMSRTTPVSLARSMLAIVS